MPIVKLALVVGYSGLIRYRTNTFAVMRQNSRSRIKDMNGRGAQNIMMLPPLPFGRNGVYSEVRAGNRSGHGGYRICIPSQADCVNYSRDEVLRMSQEGKYGSGDRIESLNSMSQLIHHLSSVTGMLQESAKFSYFGTVNIFGSKV